MKVGMTLMLDHIEVEVTLVVEEITEEEEKIEEEVNLEVEAILVEGEILEAEVNTEEEVILGEEVEIPMVEEKISLKKKILNKDLLEEEVEDQKNSIGKIEGREMTLMTIEI